MITTAYFSNCSILSVSAKLPAKTTEIKVDLLPNEVCHQVYGNWAEIDQKICARLKPESKCEVIMYTDRVNNMNPKYYITLK